MCYTVMLDQKTRRQRLTKHFSFEEMTRTSYRADNTPDEFAFNNLLYTCRILESVRCKFGFPIPITSGFRTSTVNSLAGGSKNSYHLDGRAVDIDVSSMCTEKIDKLETILWMYNPVELIRYSTKHIIHVAF